MPTDKSMEALPLELGQQHKAGDVVGFSGGQVSYLPPPCRCLLASQPRTMPMSWVMLMRPIWISVQACPMYLLGKPS